MAIDYGAPKCPDSPESPKYARMPGRATCPRSDTYRAIESGNPQAIFGWLFRCRTCGSAFFRATREMGEAGMRQGRLDQLARQAQQER